MIIVDVNVFILDKFYDFELNEDAKNRLYRRYKRYDTGRQF